MKSIAFMQMINSLDVLSVFTGARREYRWAGDSFRAYRPETLPQVVVYAVE
jgi:hypothetical protein